MTNAALHDNNRCTELLEETDKAVYADSAYSGSKIADNLPEGCENHICEKGTRNHPLTEEQKENNQQKSKIRCRIEHIFGQMTGQLHGINIRSIGLTRAWFNIGLLNLIYNFITIPFPHHRIHIIIKNSQAL